MDRIGETENRKWGILDDDESLEKKPNLILTCDFKAHESIPGSRKS